MKKHRLTKITIKTRETVSLSKNAANETPFAVCPVCHTPISIQLPPVENSAAESEKRLLPAINSEN